MRCSYCNQDIQKKWNYCPKCGARILEKITFSDLVNRQLDHLRRVFRLDEYKSNVQPPRNGIMISITHGFREPHISIIPHEIKRQPYETRQVVKRKLPEDIIEPEMEIKRLSDAIIVKVELPGVKSENDIDLNTFSNSVELRAFAGDKGYFKILKIPRKYRLLDKKLEKNQFIMKFAV